MNEFTQPSPRHYIWDLDGTLLDSYPVIVAAAKAAVWEAGLRDPESEILRRVKRDTLSAYLREAASRSGCAYDILYSRYRENTHRMDERITLMDGAGEALERLARAGGVHYVYTHRGDSSGPILRSLGILPYFREVVTSSYGFPPKPAGDGILYLTEKYRLPPADTWYIGDRALDVLCGKAAGVRSVLLLPEDSCVIPTGQEDRIIRSLREL